MTPIDIQPIDDLHLDIMGIYRIWFGSKYYIGATGNTSVRIEGHLKSIKGGFNGERIGKNSLTNIVRHLRQNDYISTAFMEVVEVIEYEEQLPNAEQKWLDASFGDINCLNHCFKAHRKVNGRLIRSIPYIS